MLNVKTAPDFERLAGVRPLNDDELSQLEANILADPKHERMPPIVIWQCNKLWLVVEGHNQHRLRTKHGLKIKYYKIDFVDRQSAMRYAYEAQFGRRNLSPDERALAAVEYAKLLPIGSTSGGTTKSNNIRKAAQYANTSERTVWRADKVNEHGAKALKDAVTAGDVSVSDAASVADLPRKQQANAVKAVKQGKAKTLKAAATADLGKCPNCAGTKWTEDDDGIACEKCHHPHGEPAGDVDDDRILTQRQKTVKTVEALMRAFDDLHLLCPKPDEHTKAIADTKRLLKIAKEWA